MYIYLLLFKNKNSGKEKMYVLPPSLKYASEKTQTKSYSWWYSEVIYEKYTVFFCIFAPTRH